MTDFHFPNISHNVAHRDNPLEEFTQQGCDVNRWGLPVNDDVFIPQHTGDLERAYFGKKGYDGDGEGEGDSLDGERNTDGEDEGEDDGEGNDEERGMDSYGNMGKYRLDGNTLLQNMGNIEASSDNGGAIRNVHRKTKKKSNG
jgi:hypothetical protein